MNRRFLLDSDGTNFLRHLSDDLHRDVAEMVQECPPNVTTYLVCSAAGNAFFPTRVGNVCPHCPALLAAHARGEDPLGALLQGLKEAGKETFITFRMNDVHFPTDEGRVPRIRREHPEFVVGLEEVRGGKAGWMSYCLDYSRAEVREYFLALIREQVDLYGHVLDGFQLDWMRFPRHLSGTPEEVWEKRQVLTDFTSEARRVLDGAGRRILLAARVPTSLDACRRTGLDIGEWSQQGLVDFIVASPFLTTDFAMPIGAMRAAMGGNPTPIYAAFDISHGDHQIHCPESLRATASGLYGSDADGLYAFNFPCYIERIGARPYHWLAGLEDPGTASEKPLLFSVSHREKRKTAGVDLPYALPATLPVNGQARLPLALPAAALPAWRCIVSVVSGGDVALTVNCVPARERTQTRRADLFVQYENRYTPDAKPSRFRPPEDACRLFYASPEALRPGENVLAVENRADREITIDRVNLGLW